MSITLPCLDHGHLSTMNFHHPRLISFILSCHPIYLIRHTLNYGVFHRLWYSVGIAYVGMDIYVRIYRHLRRLLHSMTISRE